MASQWLEDFHAGQEAVFKQAVSEHSACLKAYSRAFVHDDAVAEDLVQETWLRAYRNRRSFEGRGSFLGWLLAICRTTALSHLRTRRHREARVGTEDESLARELSSPGESDVLDRLAQAQTVRTALLALPPRQRDTVVLRLLEDRSVRDTARIMDCAEGTVKAALSTALRNLRGLLEAGGEHDSESVATEGRGREFKPQGGGV